MSQRIYPQIHSKGNINQQSYIYANAIMNHKKDGKKNLMTQLIMKMRVSTSKHDIKSTVLLIQTFVEYGGSFYSIEAK